MWWCLPLISQRPRVRSRETWMWFLGQFQDRSAIDNWRKYLCLSHYATRSAWNSAAHSGRWELSEEADGACEEARKQKLQLHLEPSSSLLFHTAHEILSSLVLVCNCQERTLSLHLDATLSLVSQAPEELSRREVLVWFLKSVLGQFADEASALLKEKPIFFFLLFVFC